ncbi:MAG: hypothetical protein HRU20_08185 [Pseudomonadales bacterium]|nr:hypothetical protein [Pseudomonadales bacterium]
MKVSRKSYNIIIRSGLVLLAAFLLIGISNPQWLQSIALSKQITFYTLGVIFLCYTLALFYSVLFSNMRKELDITAKLMQLIRAPLYLCITGFCFYYAWYL